MRPRRLSVTGELKWVVTGELKWVVPGELGWVVTRELKWARGQGVIIERTREHAAVEGGCVLAGCGVFPDEVRLI